MAASDDLAETSTQTGAGTEKIASGFRHEHNHPTPLADEVVMIIALSAFISLVIAGPGVPPSRNTSNTIAFVSLQANSISGHIYDERRTPIADMQVELLNDVDSILQRTKTDTSGLFVFRRLTSGIFQIRIQTYNTNYISQTQRVQLEPTRAFEQVDFVLASKRATSATAAGQVIFVQEVPEEAKNQFERGSALFQKEQRPEAFAALSKAVEIFPDYFEALQLLGSEYVKQQEYEKAIPLLTRASEVNRQAHQSLYSLSVAQYNLKQVSAAVETMRRAIILNQKSVTANLWLGMLLRQTAKLDEAETYLLRADKLSGSKSADAHWQLALVYNQLKRPTHAADHLEMFLKVQPDSKDKELIGKLIKRLREQSPASQ